MSSIILRPSWLTHPLSGGSSRCFTGLSAVSSDSAETLSSRSAGATIGGVLERMITGSTVAGFSLGELLGEGATGRVYRASGPAQQPVALKLLALDLARDERFRKRFLRESQIATALDHPHIVPVLEAGEEDGTIYLAMRLVEGPDLREILDRSRLDPGPALAIVEQIADALDAAHDAGLVHRDVKPANVLLEGDHAYLCDFGLARHVSAVSTTRTTERGFVGTIDYIAPEQIAGGKVDKRADVYSLACLLFECLAGAKPFDRETDLATVYAHLNEPPPRISEIRPELPRELDEVFATALAKAPEERYASCGELVAAARAGLEGTTYARRPPRRRRLLVGAGLIAAAAATAVVVLLDSTRTTPPPTGPAQITQTSIDGLELGRTRSYYAQTVKPPGFKGSVLSGPGFPEMSFQVPEIGVYFPKHGKRADMITTWNSNFRTAAGIGPCSTVAEMHRAYGPRAHANWSGTSPDGKKHVSWQLGQNLLFMAQDQHTISAVVLFKGVPHEKHGGSPRDYANFVGADETEAVCK